MSTVYAVVDVETTGGRILDDRITEIAIYLYDGAEIIDQFQSLINPERYIPAQITQLTGISNEMVASAPKFYEVAKRIVEMTEGAVLVAHNAHFDYSFIRNEFKHLGYTYQRRTLCTVRLARRVFPGLPSYALGNLTRHFGISLTQAHRAAADARATVDLLARLLDKDASKADKSIIDHEIKAASLPPRIAHEEFIALPEATGVYYFYNEQGDIIYIGKSNNIKKRVAQHFATNLKDKKSIEFKNQVASMSYEITGNELIALLLESDEIKRHQPLFNRAQRRARMPFGIFDYEDKQGYIQFFVDRVAKQSKSPLVLTQSRESAQRLLYSKVQEHNLCMKLAHLYQHKGACFDYHVKKCAGACIGEEAADAYNQRAMAAIAAFHPYRGKSFILAGRGRSVDERGIVVIEEGRYLGFGFVEADTAIQGIDTAKDYIRRYHDNRDVQKIIAQWIKQHPNTVWVEQR